MKRLTWLTLLLLTVLLAACGRSPQPADPSLGPDPDRGRPRPGNLRDISFWHIQTNDVTGAVVAEGVRRTEAATNGLDIVDEAILNDPFKTRLATAFGADSPPDVFHTWGGGALAAYADSGKALALDTLLPEATERLHPGALEFCRVDGKLYAVPVDVAVVPLWYNQKIFAEQRLEPPKTVTELVDVCRQLAGNGVTPIALGNSKSWPGAFWYIYFATRYGGRDALAAGRFEDPAFVKAGEQIRALVELGAFQEGFNGIDDQAARRTFFQGQAAMLLMGSWLVANAKAEAPEFVDQMGCVPFPAAGQKPAWDATVVGGVNAAYAVSADTERPEDCARLLRELVSDQGLKDWAETGRIPALAPTAAASVFGDDPPETARILFAAETIQLYYDQYLPPALASKHKQTTQAIFAGTMTPAEAAAEMARAAAAE